MTSIQLGYHFSIRAKTHSDFVTSCSMFFKYTKKPKLPFQLCLSSVVYMAANKDLAELSVGFLRNLRHSPGCVFL